MIVLVALTVGLLGSVGTASAQHERADSARHRADCRLAAQVLTYGEPSNKRDWAFGKITGCGSLGGETLARMMLAHQHEESYTPALDTVVGTMSRLVEPVIYEAALELASDRTAGAAARVQAIRALYFQIKPGWIVSYEALIRGEPGTGWTDRAEGALPSGALEEAEQALSAIVENSSSTPPTVCAAAGQVRESIWTERDCGGDVSIEICMDPLNERTSSGCW